ncbi:D-isomer specific 2-hydroxyacid dehydrogenase protein [Pseudomonas syringae pv. antirrhini]|uniref:D-isomer specific 2-hydroxyacid dehydrogenase family protein n=1 Tax=Pseudomonas syringae pv. antirrhini TaxID=251702 RepID=A0A0P9K9E1_9PSED|nr:MULTISPECIES: D-2-hydroxyacid dehydrogenase family protein [Pseudomonas]KPW51906.1 D-isomer specific 2-hydroxyacid dehydrogenase family protein [Pseudomonas syringae pv. antirrhini]RMP39166.1 D-isomer specific 2-hydroxyacid dehydrogenase protein [Pseudomonas syringae pv. antirrhini]RMP45571.1 D-isomer specific 2-hydroxyacid dehydrogenase protein [Pseudomonas syringae pv. antirrhini]WIN09317.1 D-2-hydroxyacid dehydrogenase family protein [Pseudomonas syringae pv. antirrhini str. 126]
MTLLKIAVLDDWQNVASGVVDWSALDSVGEISFLHDYPADTATMVQRLQGFDVLCVMRERTLFDDVLLSQLPNLRLLVTGGMRNAAIDTAAAERQGIVVCGTESYKNAAPELTWALIMGITRNLVAEANSLRAGNWQVGLGSDLHGKTLGILGLGSIGKWIARYGQAFGMNVIAWSQNLTAEAAAESGVTYVSKQQLFEQADVLSVHLVLSDRSRGLVDAQALGWMKPSAYLINSSRGPIIDQAALIKVLQQRHIAGAALDVFDIEPLPADHPFRTLNNVLATPHIGYVTENNYRTFYGQMIEAIQAWHAGSPIRVFG